MYYKLNILKTKFNKLKILFRYIYYIDRLYLI